MWASERVVAILGVLVGVIAAFAMWSISHHTFTVIFWTTLAVSSIVPLFYAVRGYPVAIGVTEGEDKERREIKKLIARLNKWLLEHPEG